jgi:RNA polymerase sigma-70 factor (ECF subfamily)
METPLTPGGTSVSPRLWREFAAPLRSFVSKRAPHEVDVDDVLQEVFLRIQEQLPKLRDADRIGPWIFQIARNVVADGFRRRRRREAPDDPIASESTPPFTDEHERTGEAALTSCLAPMIRQLPGAYREAIELTELGGMTQVEAARVVGISTSGMKSRVQRGRSRLETIIKEFCRIEIDVRGAVIECDPLQTTACCGERVAADVRR